MNFYEWAAEYDVSRNKLKRQIKDKKQAIKTAPPSKLAELKHDLAVLQGMLDDSIERAAELRSKGDKWDAKETVDAE